MRIKQAHKADAQTLSHSGAVPCHACGLHVRTAGEMRKKTYSYHYTKVGTGDVEPYFKKPVTTSCFDKTARASEFPNTNGCIVQFSEHVIGYRNEAMLDDDYSDLSLFLFLLMGDFFIIGLIILLSGSVDLSVLFFLFLVAVILTGPLVRRARHLVFGATICPFVFDRRSGLVFVLSVRNRCFKEDAYDGLLKSVVLRWLDSFRPWRDVDVLVYSWNDLSARKTTYVHRYGKYSTDVDYIEFVFEFAGKKPLRCFRFVPVGSIAPTWEHIRRFMEEDGPAVSPLDLPYAKPSSLGACFEAKAGGRGWIAALMTGLLISGLFYATPALDIGSLVFDNLPHSLPVVLFLLVLFGSAVGYWGLAWFSVLYWMSVKLMKEIPLPQTILEGYAVEKALSRSSMRAASA